MRVIAGKFRSRRLKSVSGLAVRPTPDRLREALFNVLAGQIEGAVFVDAYAGTGAIGIEALSRGALRVLLIERNMDALETIRENLRSLGIEHQVNVLRGRAATLLREHPADIVFIDPPYENLPEYKASLEALSLVVGGVAIAQHASRISLDDAYGNLQKSRVLRQGDNSLSFYELASKR